MGKRRYRIDAATPEQVEVSWGFGLRNVEVSHGGKPLCTFQGSSAFQRGATVPLSDGRNLRVCWEKSLIGSGPALWIDGRPLRGSLADARTKLVFISRLLYFVGGFSLLVIGFSVFSYGLDDIGLGWVAFGFLQAAAFLALGPFVARGSKPAIVTATVLWGLDSVFVIFEMLSTGGFSFGIIIRIMILVALFKGVAVVAELEKQKLKESADAFE